LVHESPVPAPPPSFPLPLFVNRKIRWGARELSFSVGRRAFRRGCCGGPFFPPPQTKNLRVGLSHMEKNPFPRVDCKFESFRKPVEEATLDPFFLDGAFLAKVVLSEFVEAPRSCVPRPHLLSTAPHLRGDVRKIFFFSAISFESVF